MKDAGFELRKFHTNDPNLQTTINKIEKFQPLEENLKVLGIDWHKQNDSFIIDLNKIYEADIELPTTKRNVLKIIASIYDPIGIISPVVVLFKILFQKISLLKCEWDSDLNPELAPESKPYPNPSSAQLPEFRCQRSLPFQITGVDYLGPLLVKPTCNSAESNNEFLAKVHVAL